MPKPNNIYKNSQRSLILELEETFSNYADAKVRQCELKVIGSYHMVKLTSFKFGARPSKYNGFKPSSHHYAVRAYSKPN